MDQIKASVLRLHQDYLRRHEAARVFLEAPRGITDGSRRFVFYAGGERDAKVECLRGLQRYLKDEDEVTKVWSDLLQGGVNAFFTDRRESRGDGPESPKTKRSSAERSRSTSTVGSVESTNFSAPSKLTEDLSLSEDIASGSSSDCVQSPVSCDEGSAASAIGTFKPISKRRIPTVGERGRLASHSECPSDQVIDYEEECNDSAYSSSGSTMPLTPPASVGFNEHFERYNLSRRGSPAGLPPLATKFSQVDVGGSISGRSLSRHGSVQPGPTPRFLELFPSLNGTVVIQLVPEKIEDPDLLLAEKVIYATALDRRHTFSASPFAPQLMGTLMHNGLPSPTIFGPTKINLFSDKLALEIQNEVREILMRSIPTSDETSPLGEFPDDSKSWLLDDESDLFAPVMSSGFEGSGDALCPSLDLIIAVGSYGREQKPTAISDESERKSAELATALSEDLEILGCRGIDSRGVRINLRYALRNMIPYLYSHPGANVEDISAGAFLIPTAEACLRTNPHVRLLIIDFDLRTGCPAILGMRALLPPEMFKLIIVGESLPHANPQPSMMTGGNRIYVRNSVGNTTISFSALPAPPQQEKPKHRRMENAKVAVMGRADVIISPWSDRTSREYLCATQLVRESICVRRVACGVIDVHLQSRRESPQGLNLNLNMNVLPPRPGPPPALPPPPTPPPKESSCYWKAQQPPSPSSNPVLPPPITIPLHKTSSTRSSRSSNTPRIQFSPPPSAPPSIVDIVLRRDSDANVTGDRDSVSIIVPSQTSSTPPPVPPTLEEHPEKKMEFRGIDWVGSSYLDDGDEEEADDEEEDWNAMNRIGLAKGGKRKGSKALRWLGLEPS